MADYSCGNSYRYSRCWVLVSHALLSLIVWKLVKNYGTNQQVLAVGASKIQFNSSLTHLTSQRRNTIAGVIHETFADTLWIRNTVRIHTKLPLPVFNIVDTALSHLKVIQSNELVLIRHHCLICTQLIKCPFQTRCRMLSP